MTLAYVLEMVQISMVTYDAIRIFSYGFGNPLEVNKIGLYWFDNVIMISISESRVAARPWRFSTDVRRQVNFVCQLFYAWRIRVLSQSIITSLFVGLVRNILVGNILSLMHALIFRQHLHNWLWGLQSAYRLVE